MSSISASCASGAGIVFAVGIYSLVNLGGEGSHSWGVAMSTDTALALGTLAFVAPRWATRMRVFLLTVVVMDDLAAILAAAGASIGDLVKVTIFYVDIDDFARLNEVYASHMPGPRPARSAPANVNLPRGLLVSIDAIAVIGPRLPSGQESRIQARLANSGPPVSAQPAASGSLDSTVQRLMRRIRPNSNRHSAATGSGSATSLPNRDDAPA